MTAPREALRGDAVARRSRAMRLGGVACLATGLGLMAAALHRADLSPAPSVSSPEPPRRPAPDPSGPTDQPTAAPSAAPSEADDEPATLVEQRERMFWRMEQQLLASSEQMARVREIFRGSPWLGQGNPDITRHPMSRQACRALRAEAGLPPVTDIARCGARNMVPVWGDGESAETASLCVDQYEFPDVACDYPVVNVRASEADALCRAVGKRLCDAHEWEGACAGKLLPPGREYAWNRPRPEASLQHNQTREIVWAYGPRRDHPRCATGSQRSAGCDGGSWGRCGSNTYPAGAFPLCKSPFGVFDQHGNAAEHMSLPEQPEELRGGGPGGVTEMKGSWFIFSTMAAHEDDCRWRAPGWHATRIRNPGSHRNYHLGFRCCKDIAR